MAEAARETAKPVAANRREKKNLKEWKQRVG